MKINEYIKKCHKTSTAKQIAAKYGCSRSHVYTLARKHGVKLMQ